jgi:5'(3')-deoxyribonucleotidase
MKTLYIDMDNVIVDFPSAFSKIDENILQQYEDNKDEIDGIFGLMEPMSDAINSIEFLSNHFDVYILSTAPWNNPSAWTDKLLWIKKHLPEIAYKRLILSHHKNLNHGDYLIDDRLHNGVKDFKGEHIHFGQGEFNSWDSVLQYLIRKENLK